MGKLERAYPLDGGVQEPKLVLAGLVGADATADQPPSPHQKPVHAFNAFGLPDLHARTGLTQDVQMHRQQKSCITPDHTPSRAYHHIVMQASMQTDCLDQV